MSNSLTNRLTLFTLVGAVTLLGVNPPTVVPRNVANIRVVTAINSQDALKKLRAGGANTLVRLGKYFLMLGKPLAAPPKADLTFHAVFVAPPAGSRAVLRSVVGLPPAGDAGPPCDTTLCAIWWPTYPVWVTNHVDFGNPKDASGKCIPTPAGAMDLLSNYSANPKNLTDIVPCPGDKYVEYPDDHFDFAKEYPQYDIRNDAAEKQLVSYHLAAQWSLDHVESTDGCKYFKIKSFVQVAIPGHLLQIELIADKTMLPPLPPSTSVLGQEFDPDVNNPKTNPYLTCAVKVFVSGPQGTLWKA